MAECLVLHAEGPGDLGRPGAHIAPGDSLLPDDLGPAHILVARTIDCLFGVPRAALDFKEPYRTAHGHRAYGGQLLVREILDQILTGWQLNPLVVVFLVDADDAPVNDRRTILRDALERSGLDGAVGVVVKEFESWLIADQAALTRVLGKGHTSPVAVEDLECRAAKNMLMEWSKSHARPGRDALAIRRELAEAVDLDTLNVRCTSFAVFRREIEALNHAISH